MPEVLRTAVLRGAPLLLFAWGLLEMFLAWRLGAARGDLGVLAGMVPDPCPGEFGAGAERLASARRTAGRGEG